MDNISPKNYQKRRIYFIDKKFQSNFIMKFCILVAAGGLLATGLVYLLALNTATVSFVNSRVVVTTTANFILPILIQTIAIVLVIVGLATIFITLRFTHRIAGPLYRFRKVLQSLKTGDFSENFRIRKLDQLQDLADDLNSMITTTRQDLNALREKFLSLKQRIDSLTETNICEQKQAYLEELKNIVQDLDRIIQHFKV